ncbi:MipA/OmpV family protein [Neisseriaceae bacterium CLB008]|nr:MipA/OmpV family protein [Neisseriaceae bacterium]
MNLKPILLSAVLLSGMSAAAHAELTLGLNASAYRMPYKGMDTKYYGFPAIDYKNEVVYFKGLGGGVYLLNSPKHEVSVSARLGAHHFKPKDSDDRQVRDLDRRRSSVMAGVSYAYKNDWGDLTAELQGDVSGHSKGYVADVSYSNTFTHGKFAVKPSVGVTYRDKKWNDYYYGVSSGESNKTGLSRYKADGSVQPYAQVTVSYAITPQWITYASAYYEHLGSEAKDSPMVDRSYVGALSTGVMYRF